ncbi:phage portal protein [Metaclostridioides mangenotii]|uniref:phage portal protein n=1 Tax=Metaclostridioides mangenotii TaxID=1540 RepID=UPI0009E09B57|nr:phage portal protein [Clostridioides mangenotii]
MDFNKVVGEIRTKGLNLKSEDHLEFLTLLTEKFTKDKSTYDEMYKYYKGETKAMETYKMLTARSDLKINVNYIKKFIKEEAAYTVGNKITYEAVSGDTEVVGAIDYNTAHLDELHDSDLMKYMLIFSKVFEVYYTDPIECNFSTKIIKPTEGFAFTDDITGQVLLFLHFYTSEFDENVKYVDIYTKGWILHCDEDFTEISEPHSSIFDEVPVTIGTISYEGYYDSLYSDLKGLQDAFETNLSDAGNEISDFRNAYLVFKGCTIDSDKLNEMKEKGALLVGEEGEVAWLIKNINDTFIQNSLDRYVDTMYQIACHINSNEQMVSNLSGVALRSRLIALENKCKLEEAAHRNMVKNRLRFLFKYLLITTKKEYDFRNVKILYTPLIPTDDLATAQMLAQLPDETISKDTARSLFSFVNNAEKEKEKVENEITRELELENPEGF